MQLEITTESSPGERRAAEAAALTKSVSPADQGQAVVASYVSAVVAWAAEASEMLSRIPTGPILDRKVSASTANIIANTMYPEYPMCPRDRRTSRLGRESLIRESHVAMGEDETSIFLPALLELRMVFVPLSDVAFFV